MSMRCSPFVFLAVLTLSGAATRAVADEPPAAPTAQSDAGEPRANTSPDAPKPTRARPPAAKSPTAADHVDLSTATVTGDREQPKVMYIVPWKRADIGDLSGKPMNSLLDEALAPVDRDEFKREVAYYDAMQPGATASGATRRKTSGAAAQAEK